MFGCERMQSTKPINSNSDIKFFIEKNDGKISNISLKDEKVLVLNFFTSTCGACKEEIPNLQYLHTNLKNKINIIGILGEKIDKKEALEFIKKYKISYPIINQPKIVKLLSSAVGGVFGVPVTIVYAKNGQVIGKFLGLTPFKTLKKSILSGL